MTLPVEKVTDSPAPNPNRLLSELVELVVRLSRAEEEFAIRDRAIEELRTRNQQLEAQFAPSTHGSDAGSGVPAVGREPECDKSAVYDGSIHAIAAAVDEALPCHATVLVVSKGDDRLLELRGRQAWHFPHTSSGSYLGYYPKDSDAAIAYLDASRARGAQYLLLPAQAAWWLDYYPGLRSHLEAHHRRIWERDEVGIIFALGPDESSLRSVSSRICSVYAEIASVIESCQGGLDRRAGILDWASGLDLADYFTQLSVFSPPSDDLRLPYLDGTIDVVVCAASPERVREARRVASGCLIVVDRGEFPVDGSPTRPRVTVEWKTERTSIADDASIIIPVHNSAPLTDTCLTSLTTSLPRDFQGEIIVFDDASTDGTRPLLKEWQRRDARIQVLRGRTNAGFISACNRAAKASTRKYLVFLNNDTEPHAGWLTALLDTFQRFPKVGAVGGKLLQPDGSLQEAGGLIFRDGSAAHFMRDQRDLSLPVINYVREVDYCSAALLATPRRLFAKLRGFDVRYRPAYYEDVDYCFRVRRSGWQVYYQPASVVTHREGGSCTGVARTMKQHFFRNQETFGRVWKNVLRHQPIRPADADRAAWQRLAERGSAASAGAR